MRAEIIDSFLIGPVILPNSLNINNYLIFLQEILPTLLEDLPLLLRQNMWFIHDGAPPHFSVPVRQYLTTIYPNQWIGRGNDAPVKWPARSPDLTPCDFFLWSAMKTKVYSSPVESVADLNRKI